MRKFHNSENAGRPIAEQPDFRVSVTNFGPIKSGYVDLRPLTIFVGPSNSGKTYFAILVYAIRQKMGGLRRLPVVSRVSQPLFHINTGPFLEYAKTEEKDVQTFIARLSEEGRPFKFSDFPVSFQDSARAILGSPNALGAAIGSELERCFDLDSLSDLVRLPECTQMGVELRADEATRSLWRFEMCVSNSEISTNGQIEDIVLLPEGWSFEETEVRRSLNQLQELLEIARSFEGKMGGTFLADFFDGICTGTGDWRGETHYLPAARSGIMQSHRVIASSLIGRSTRIGLERYSDHPTFSGVTADFMQRLILFEEEHGRKDLVTEAADALEREALKGQIRSSQRHTGGYPEFIYRPSAIDRDIRMTQVSSMVSEIAPVVLFLRGIVSPGDMLIIEEPEAHLHPAAQTQMARTLARLIRAGVKVVVTTHSDWLLMELANLMRVGELEGLSKEHDSDSAGPVSLLPEDVGVWLFREQGDSSGSTIEEIPFDRSEGIEPEEYESVAEALYNRSAALQNQFQEVAGAAAREQE